MNGFLPRTFDACASILPVRLSHALRTPACLSDWPERSRLSLSSPSRSLPFMPCDANASNGRQCAQCAIVAPKYNPPTRTISDSREPSFPFGRGCFAGHPFATVRRATAGFFRIRVKSTCLQATYVRAGKPSNGMTDRGRTLDKLPTACPWAPLVSGVYWVEKSSALQHGIQEHCSTFGEGDKNSWRDKKQHTTPRIRWSSPTQLLVRPSLVYRWESRRDPEFSSGYGRMCHLSLGVRLTMARSEELSRSRKVD